MRLENALLLMGLGLLLTSSAWGQEAGVPTEEAKLRKQLDETAEALRYARKVSSGLNEQLAGLQAEQARSRKVLEVLGALDPKIAAAVTAIADREMAVDGSEEIRLFGCPRHG